MRTIAAAVLILGTATTGAAFAAGAADGGGTIRTAQSSIELLAPPTGPAPSVETAIETAPADGDAIEDPAASADEPAPAVVQPFTWAAAKWGEAVAISGVVPDEATRTALAERAGPGVRDASLVATAPAAGAPDGFAADAAAALGALLLLDTGRAVFDGVRWQVTGEAADEAARAAATAALPVAEEVPDWLVAVTVAEPSPVADAAPQAPPSPPDEVVAEETPAAPDALAEVEAGPEIEAPLPAPDYRFAARRAGGATTLSGAVPTTALRAHAGVVTGAATGDLAIRDGAPDGFVDAARAGLAALQLLESGELGHVDGRWRLAGEAPGAGAAAEARALVAALPDAAAWAIEIATPAALARCRDGIAGFAAENVILFGSGSARVAEESLAGLDLVAGHLGECPDAIVHVEGHTDSDGSAELNLALSVARAEAVVAELIERGVRPERLYAIGYGQSLPIASNDTAEGKRQNRRIVFTVLDGHE